MVAGCTTCKASDSEFNTVSKSIRAKGKWYGGFGVRNMGCSRGYRRFFETESGVCRDVVGGIDTAAREDLEGNLRGGLPVKSQAAYFAMSNTTLHDKLSSEKFLHANTVGLTTF